MTELKYTVEEIRMLARTRLTIHYIEPELKTGLIAECCFTYPTGLKHCWTESAFPMVEENHDRGVAQDILRERALNKVWEIAGQYTLGTGVKMPLPENVVIHQEEDEWHDFEKTKPAWGACVVCEVDNGERVELVVASDIYTKWCHRIKRWKAKK